MAALSDIFLEILAPILLMVLLGAVMRWKFKIDVGTLSKLNLYVFVPAFIFDRVSNSALAWSAMGGIAAMTVLQVMTLALIVGAIGRLFRMSRKTLAAVAMAVLFYNSGNYGLPLAELAYENRGAEVQAFVLMSQNILTFTVGLGIAAWAHHGATAAGLIKVLQMPTLPTLAAALLARWYLNGHPEHHLPVAVSQTASFLSNGLVPVALITLGAQLASNPRWPRWGPVGLVMFLRLIVGPIQMAGLLFGLHWLAGRYGGAFAPLDLWPWPAELLILTAAVPTAVNTLLLTLELEGDADLAADCVFWTTVGSCLTIAIWLVAIRWFFANVANVA